MDSRQLSRLGNKLADTKLDEYGMIIIIIINKHSKLCKYISQIYRLNKLSFHLCLFSCVFYFNYEFFFVETFFPAELHGNKIGVF